MPIAIYYARHAYSTFAQLHTRDFNGTAFFQLCTFAHTHTLLSGAFSVCVCAFAMCTTDAALDLTRASTRGKLETRGQYTWRAR